MKTSPLFKPSCQRPSRSCPGPTVFQHAKFRERPHLPPRDPRTNFRRRVNSAMREWPVTANLLKTRPPKQLYCTRDTIESHPLTDEFAVDLRRNHASRKTEFAIPLKLTQQIGKIVGAE